MLKRTLLGLALIASPAFASSHYHAETVAKPAAAKLVLRDTIWKCGDNSCEAPKSGSRPAIVCTVLARQVGSLRSFTADGKALSADELGKCNARAR